MSDKCESCGRAFFGPLRELTEGERRDLVERILPEYHYVRGPFGGEHYAPIGKGWWSSCDTWYIDQLLLMRLVGRLGLLSAEDPND